jgi:hypothetical protein
MLRKQTKSNRVAAAGNQNVLQQRGQPLSRCLLTKVKLRLLSSG